MNIDPLRQDGEGAEVSLRHFRPGADPGGDCLATHLQHHGVSAQPVETEDVARIRESCLTPPFHVLCRGM